jgi:hypothetical protein
VREERSERGLLPRPLHIVPRREGMAYGGHTERSERETVRGTQRARDRERDTVREGQ